VQAAPGPASVASICGGKPQQAVQTRCCLLYWYKSTCFTGKKKVHVITQTCAFFFFVLLVEPRIFAAWLSFLARTAGGAGDGAHLWMFRWPDALAAESSLKRAMMNVSAKNKKAFDVNA